jgi:2'-5' RNA ligase
MTQRRPQRDAGREPRLRLFVAVELPQAWLDAFASLIDQMKAALAREPLTAAARLRWVRPEAVHVTVKFLGEVPESRLGAIDAALATAAPALPRPRVALGKPGTFGRPPSVIWLGVDGDLQRLTRLAERVDAAVATAGFERDRRPFAPHLTLARIPEQLGADVRNRVATIAASFARPAVSPFEVQRISLMRSFLGPGGAHYERVSAFPSEYGSERL